MRFMNTPLPTTRVSLSCIWVHFSAAIASPLQFLAPWETSQPGYTCTLVADTQDRTPDMSCLVLAGSGGLWETGIYLAVWIWR